MTYCDFGKAVHFERLIFKHKFCYKRYCNNAKGRLNFT